MAEAKLITWLMWILGGGFYSYVLYINIATWKSDVLFFTAMLGFFVRGYFYIRRRNREDRKSNQEERLRELDIIERESKLLNQKPPAYEPPDT